MKNASTWVPFALVVGAGACWLYGCSSSGTSASANDAGASPDAAAQPVDAATPTDSPSATDGGSDADAALPPTVVGLAIVPTSGGPLRAAPGDGLSLTVGYQMSDGTTLPLSDTIAWITPSTVVASDPYDAGPGLLPDAGDGPVAFYVSNHFRPDPTGVLFVTRAGSIPDAGVTVTAQLPDGGLLSAVVAIEPQPVGNVDSGQNLWEVVLQCGNCHGATGGGSPPTILPNDGGVVYDLEGNTVPYPAPGLNNAPNSGNLATDPHWSAPLFGMAAQADMDNMGVALRAPMPVWLGKHGATGKALSGQDFADIYAWLLTQTQ